MWFSEYFVSYRCAWYTMLGHALTISHYDIIKYTKGEQWLNFNELRWPPVNKLQFLRWKAFPGHFFLLAKLPSHGLINYALYFRQLELTDRLPRGPLPAVHDVFDLFTPQCLQIICWYNQGHRPQFRHSRLTSFWIVLNGVHLSNKKWCHIGGLWSVTIVYEMAYVLLGLLSMRN